MGSLNTIGGRNDGGKAFQALDLSLIAHPSSRFSALTILGEGHVAMLKLATGCSIRLPDASSRLRDHFHPGQIKMEGCLTRVAGWVEAHLGKRV